MYNKKYLKYKTKYLELKNQIGKGNPPFENTVKERVMYTGNLLGEIDEFASCGDIINLINSKGTTAINNLSWKDTKPPISNIEWQQIDINDPIKLASNKMCDYIVDNSGNPTNKADCNLYVNKCKYKTLGPLIVLENPTRVRDREFYRTNLSRIRIPDTVIEIGKYAFYGNPLLTSITIPDSVIKIGDFAFYTNPLKSVTIGKSVKTIGESAFRDTNLTIVTIPDSVIEIGNYAFCTNPLLRSVTIGKSVKTIGKYAFSENPLLTSVSIPQRFEYQINSIFNNIDNITFNYYNIPV